MWVKQLMTPAPACCKPSDTLDKVAKVMLESDCGEVPICENNRLVGVVTDRDIICRAVATEKNPMSVPVADVMSKPVYSVTEEAKIDTALEMMEYRQIRRLPVVDTSGRIVGIVSQADVARKLPSSDVASLLRAVSNKTRKPAVAAV